MQNLLIVEDDIIQAHLIANSVCKEISNIRLYNIANTGMEAINIIKEEKVDIILLDLKLPDMEGIEILNYISKHNLKKYEDSIIIITGEMSLLPKVIGNKNIYNYFSKTNGLDFVIKNIKELVEEKQNCIYNSSLKEQIKNELQKLNFDFSYVGTKYLYECIYECYYKSNIYDINLNNEIYPIISNKYKKSINSIKVSIFQSITVMYFGIKEEKLCNYFGYKILRKPKTKDIIINIVQKIK